MTSALITLVLAMAVGHGGEATVTTLDGSTVKGEVAAWTAKDVLLEGADGAPIYATDLLDIRWAHEVVEAPAALHVEFVDGTRIAYAKFTLADHKATITGGHFPQPLVVSQEMIKLIELQATTPAIETALAEVQRKDAAGDALVVAKKDGQSMDYLTGSIGDVTEDQASFKWEGERVPVKRPKIAAIVFYQPKARPLAEATCELTLTDGSRIAVREAALEEGRVRAKTPAGVKLDLPLEEVARANFSSGKIAYLSDLKPTEVQWTPRIAAPKGAPAISEYGLPRYDVSYSGSPLSLLWKDDVARSRRDVRTYAKGLAIRSRTQLSYQVPRGMKRFVAIAGIDPGAASQGAVMLTIRGDDRVLWEGPVDGKGPPVELDVELQAAHRLQLLVDYGENLDYGDRLHLVEARVTK